jgi:hypothetical protein
MMTITRVVLDTPPPVTQKRTAPSIAYEVTEAPQEAESSGGPLGTTLSEIDRIIADVVPERDTDEVVAAENSASKIKNTEESSSESKGFYLRHLGGQQLSKEDISELREFAISCGYQLGFVLFSGVDEEIMGCIPDRARAKIVNTLTRSIEFPKLERDLSGYRKQHITSSLVYSNFKV